MSIFNLRNIYYLTNITTLICNFLSFEDSLALIEELKPKKTYFTHISHHLGFHSEVEDTLPKNVFLAYDGLEINL